MHTTQTDIQRHAEKFEIYRQAVERVGFDAVVKSIGATAAGAFVLVDLELTRRQYPNRDLIGYLLAAGQEYGDEFCGINDADHSVYDVLKNL